MLPRFKAAGGLRVTPIGLGLAALGRPGYLTVGHDADLGADRSVSALQSHAHAVLDAAYVGGVRYFDAARSYGCAEAFLAAWLAARQPSDVTVGSKWGYAYTGDWKVDAETPEVKELSLAQLVRQSAETRDLLGDRLDLYQIHSATIESGVLEDAAVLQELSRLRSSGLRIGLTVSGPDQPETIERALEVGGFDFVQATWNLHEPSAGSALADAHAAGVGVIVKEALANGRLTPRGAPRALTAAARDAGVGEDAYALAAALAQPWADVVLSGAASVATLQSNLAALEVEASVEPLSELREPAEDYWERRAALAWT